MQPAGGGRVTELTARPLLNALWPELAGFVQPLGGEYAGRRSALEQVPFVSGYGVEVGLLIDLLQLGGLGSLAQVDLGVRRHTSQSRGGARRDGRAGGLRRPGPRRRPGIDASGLLTQFRHDGTGFVPRSTAVAVDERPPMDDRARVPLALGRDGRLTHTGRVDGGSRRAPLRPQGKIAACRSLPRSAPVTGPEVVAHRGATAEAPEHTLAAYRRAAAIGADAVECDVRMTRDGVLVCVHDRQIAQHLQRPRRRLGAAPRRARAVPLRRPQVRPGAAGGPTTRSPPVTDEPDVENGLVLTLDRLLDYITATPGHGAAGDRDQAPDPAHPQGGGGARRLPEPLRAARATARPVEWAGKPAVRMMSFSQLAVRRMADLAPGVPTVQLIGKRLRPRPAGAADRAAPPPSGPASRCSASDPDFVADAHAAGKEVHVWTVNQPRDMDLVRDLGVDVDHHRPPRRAAPPARRAPRLSVPLPCSSRSSSAELRASLCAEHDSWYSSPDCSAARPASAQARSVSSSAAVRSAGVS